MLALSCAQMLAVAKSMHVLALPTLTRRAATALLRAHLNGAPLPTPAELARVEWRMLAGAMWPAGQPAAYRVSIGTAAIDQIAPTPAALRALRDHCASSSHLLGLSGGEVHVLLADGARPSDVLLAFVHATLLQRELTAHAHAAERPDLVRTTMRDAHECMRGFDGALRAAGWDVESAYHLEEAHARIVFVSDPEPGAEDARAERD